MADDYAASMATTGVVDIGGSIIGNIESTNDSDWFRITLTAGRSYQFDLEGTDTGQGTLTDPYLTLQNSSGSQLASDSSSGVGSNARITFAPSASGTYYLSSLGFSNLGTYTLSAADVTPGPNQPPSIMSNGAGDTANVSIAENASAVTTVAAIDADAGAMLLYSLVGGDDAAKFQINGSTGALSFVTAPNFEAPADSDHNNSYVVQVRASDGSLFDTQTITVNVTDVSPTITGGGGDNTLFATPESDTIIGFDGDDTAVFSGNLAAYTLQDLGDRVLVSGPDGNDTVFSTEHLRFADGTINYNDGDPLFDTVFYMRTNLDVFHAGVDAKAHYDAFGWKEGRDPSASFDTTFYLRRNPDVAAAGIDPLAHYLAFGLAEGRPSSAAIGTSIVGGFDAGYYLLTNLDVARAGVDPLAHFNAFGWREGRDPNAYFDTSGYLGTYGDIAAAGVNPLAHYDLFGWREGRDPSASFDTSSYLSAYGDIAAANIDPLAHFLLFGVYEGRSSFADGVIG